MSKASKANKALVFLTGLLFLASTAYGAVAVKENGTYQGEATAIDMPSNWITAFDGSTATVNPEGQVRLTIQSFTVTDSDGNVMGPVTTSTTPGLELDNSLASLVWADGEVSYAQVTFRVPDDYVSGGAFRVICDQSDDASPVEVDFEVYANTLDAEATPWNVSHTDETPVARGLLDSGSPATVTLTPTTTIAAGKLVTLNMWRSNRSTGTSANATGDLEVYYAEFYYSTN